jgi:hypothetical protein
VLVARRGAEQRLRSLVRAQRLLVLVVGLARLADLAVDAREGDPIVLRGRQRRRVRRARLLLPAGRRQRVAEALVEVKQRRQPRDLRRRAGRARLGRCALRLVLLDRSPVDLDRLLVRVCRARPLRRLRVVVDRLAVKPRRGEVVAEIERRVG